MRRAACFLIASFVTLGCNNCNGNQPDPATSTSPTASAPEPAATRAEANGAETKRPFYTLFAKGEHAGAAMARAQFSSDVRGLPESTSHPGKRPWSRDEVFDRLDAMAKKAPEGLKAMGAYAKERASEPIDNSDPASAVGGGPEAGLAAFNHGAMNLLIGRVRELSADAKTPDGIVALYTEIATIPLPVFSNSGGPTDGRDQRDVLAKELRHAVGTARWTETDAARSKVSYAPNNK